MPRRKKNVFRLLGTNFGCPASYKEPLRGQSSALKAELQPRRGELVVNIPDIRNPHLESERRSFLFWAWLLLRKMQLYKPPGVAETIDWATALGRLGVGELDESVVQATLGTVLKYREDHERVRESGVATLVKQAFERGLYSN